MVEFPEDIRLRTNALQTPADYRDSALVEFPDNRLLSDLYGEYSRNLARIEAALGVQIVDQGNRVIILGEASAQTRAKEVLTALYVRLEAGKTVESADVDRELRTMPSADGTECARNSNTPGHAPVEIRTHKKSVEMRTDAQKAYVQALLSHEMTFGIGPAGTGKTYLAVAVGVSMFLSGQVDRIILSRPAVEAGERLGYLPGDMKDKVDPYMQPLYDALHDFLPGKMLARLMENRRIEIAPLAFMRGRTLSDAFVVLDEAQNTTAMQMKMFLTRLGTGSRMAITGDPSQVDLPKGVASGLREAERLLRPIGGIGFGYFTSRDVVRHPLVVEIVEAYRHQ